MQHDEFINFMVKMLDAGAARGNFEDRRPETNEAFFNLLNQRNSGTDGVSLAEFGECSMIMVTHNMGLKEADKAAAAQPAPAQ